MPWAKIDDDAPTHPKFVVAGSIAAFGFWVAGNCYCNKWLTDGVIATAALTLLSPVVRRREARLLADRLVAAGLWAAVEGGYQVHDFLEYNPSAARVREDRKATAARKNRWKERRSERVQNIVPVVPGTSLERRSVEDGNAVRNDAHARASTRPVPSHTPQPPPVPASPWPQHPTHLPRKLAAFEEGYATAFIGCPDALAFRAEIVRAAPTWPGRHLPPKTTLLWFRDGDWHPGPA